MIGNIERLENEIVHCFLKVAKKLVTPTLETVGCVLPALAIGANMPDYPGASTTLALVFACTSVPISFGYCLLRNINGFTKDKNCLTPQGCPHNLKIA